MSDRAEIDGEIEAAEHAVEAAGREVERTRREAEVQSEVRNRGHAHGRCLPRPCGEELMKTKSTLASVFDRLRDALGAAKSQLDAVRDHIATLKEYRQKIDGAPVDQTTVERRVDELMERLRDPKGGDPHYAFSYLQERDARPPEVRLKDMLARDPERVLAAMFPNEFRAFLLKAATPKNHKGLADAARAAELAKVDAELQALEAQEEALFARWRPVPDRPCRAGRMHRRKSCSRRRRSCRA